MKQTTIILSVTTLILAVVAAALWLLPVKDNAEDYSYGTSEGLQLARQADGSLVVKDSDGNAAFPIPLRGCVIDSRFRDGRLSFREKATGREGFIDRHGMVTFNNDQGNAKFKISFPLASQEQRPTVQNSKLVGEVQKSRSMEIQSNGKAGELRQGNHKSQTSNRKSQIKKVNLRTLARSNPFYGEAAKILQGKLDENDAKRRQTILNYCEHFRTAYTTKDIDFLRQVFSDKALIIVGNVVRTTPKDGGVNGNRRVTYALHTKKDYLERLAKVFKANSRIDVRFSDFRIMRHPTRDGIYGVTLRQRYKSNRYEDDGWLFLLWDFRNPSMPVIHVRTWQPAKTVGGEDEVINMSDFNLE